MAIRYNPPPLPLAVVPGRAGLPVPQAGPRPQYEPAGGAGQVSPAVQVHFPVAGMQRMPVQDADALAPGPGELLQPGEEVQLLGGIELFAEAADLLEGAALAVDEGSRRPMREAADEIPATDADAIAERGAVGAMVLPPARTSPLAAAASMSCSRPGLGTESASMNTSHPPVAARRRDCGRGRSGYAARTPPWPQRLSRFRRCGRWNCCRRRSVHARLTRTRRLP